VNLLHRFEIRRIDIGIVHASMIDSRIFPVADNVEPDV